MIKSSIDDGFHVYHPGQYNHTVNFTVLEKEKYPPLSSNPKTGQQSYTSKKSNLDFLLYLPMDYGKDSQTTWPLIIYLHGAHLRGATLELLRQEALPFKLESENNFPFIVISPLGDGEYEFWAKDAMIDKLFKLVKEIQAELPVNAKQIYLTGNDMGGNGVWAIGLQRADYFAALAPIAGYADYPFEVPENICNLKEVPVWAFHGQRDEFVPVEVARALVDALVACGGNAQLTTSPNMKNDVPYKVYTNPDLYTWFLTHSNK
jgi:predicted peptidase